VAVNAADVIWGKLGLYGKAAPGHDGNRFHVTHHGGTAYEIRTEAKKGLQAGQVLAELLEEVCHAGRLEASPTGPKNDSPPPAVENSTLDLGVVDDDLVLR
jgi:hypothetical protein